MGIRIHQLPVAVANQIAAGEVIERPASVVKELLENAYDAKADSITIEIYYGGLNQIKISDNGSGIWADDLPLALSPHATSKISSLDDLYAIKSMGFRGEALASIASIAKVIISSRPMDQETAMRLCVEAEQLKLEPCARSLGTTLEVNDLFYNAPVRKRFLKSQQLEFQAIEMVVKRFALSAPNIALTLKHNGKVVLNLPQALNEAAIRTRMTQLFGLAFVKDAIYLDIEHGSLSLQGWISGPNYQRSQNDKQWVYINQRMVKDKLINHALKLAYDGLLHPGRFPCCLLYLRLPSLEVDVNVHPTKHEVRFVNPRLVHDFIHSQLKKALGNNKQESTAAENYQYEPVKLSNALINQSLPVQKAVIDEAFECSWVILNQQYALVFKSEGPFVVDVKRLYSAFLMNQLKTAAFPLSQRPLLVPVTYKIKNKNLAWEAILLPYGIQIRLEEDHLVVLSLPIMLPYLDLQQFLALIEDKADAIVALSQCQKLDIRLLSPDERLALNHCLIKSEADSYCKAFREEDCRMFLDA